MNSKIYIIKNSITEKVYIGQTTKTLEERLQKHIYDSCIESKLKRPLYQAMQKYGSENFYIELLEECEVNLADDREQYWIKFYNAYGSGGYNATIGGKKYEPYDYEYIAELIKNKLHTKEIAEQVGCCKQVIYRVAKLYNLCIEGSFQDKKVCQSDIDGNIINIFDNTSIAAKYIKDTLIINTPESTIRKNISRCCNHKNRTKAYGYSWSHIEYPISD